MIATLRRALRFGALLALAGPALTAGAAAGAPATGATAAGAPATGAAATAAATVSTVASPIVARTSPSYVSFAVDLDQITGGTFWSQAPDARGNAPVAPYDFTRPRLRILAQALAPAYLRISGTAANKTYYDLSATPPTTPPGAYERILTRAEWDSIGAFARSIGVRLVLGINAGPGPRDASGNWLADNARALLSYTAGHHFPLAAVEFGNEPNLFSLVSGLPSTSPPPTTSAICGRSTRCGEASFPVRCCSGRGASTTTPAARPRTAPRSARSPVRSSRRHPGSSTCWRSTSIRRHRRAAPASVRRSRRIRSRPHTSTG